MPEIAEVRTVARTLNRSLPGNKIKDINVIYDRIIDQDTNEFKNILIGKTIESVSSFGKYLLFNLGEYTLISHLRMEGKYFIKKAEEPIEKHEHVIFIFDDFTLRYHDTRKFGRMRVLKTEDVYSSKEIKKLGIEPDNDSLTKEYIYKSIHNKNKPIKTLLLDQSIINGLGNIYVDEVLFASNINPNRSGSSITLDECDKIRISSKAIIEKATELGGSTIRSYTSSLGVTGHYQDYLKVHTKEICPNCKNKIKKIISALPRKVLWLILILMIIYNVINTVYGVFNKKLDLRIGKATMYTTEDKTMIPTIKTNDLIITKKCQPDDLNLQDIIIFDENGITKIQRITKIQGHGENSYYTTKGDNNYHNNNVIIEYNQIKGKFEKRIPLLGLIVKMLQSKITTVFVIIILVLLFVFNRDMKMKSIKRRKNKKIDQLRKQNN